MSAPWGPRPLCLPLGALGQTSACSFVHSCKIYAAGLLHSNPPVKSLLLNRVFILYVFYHVLRSAPYPADGQLKASGLSLPASQFV